MSMSSTAVRPEGDPGEESAASTAGDALVALAAAAGSVAALAGNGTGSRPLIARALACLDRATRAAEELADAVAGREIRVRAIADAAVSAGTASRRLRIAR